MAGEKDETLSCLFDKALELHEDLSNSTEATNSESFQEKVKKGILMLEDATRLVSVLDIFSKNEHFSEIPTEHLKYLLLPVLLGDLTNKLVESDRGQVIEISQVYFRDYLQRCKDYGLADITVPQKKSAQDGEDASSKPPGRPDLAKMNTERNAKMARYSLQKQLESEIKVLRVAVAAATRDEDVMREFYLKLIQRFVNTSLDEIGSLDMELEMLAHMEAMRAGKVAPEPEKKRKPMQPVIITKDKLQKEVYGMGYPGLPVLSIEEFYDKRVADGIWQPPSQGNSLMDRAVLPEEEALKVENEERLKEEGVENDDAEVLGKARAFDDYKDEHRRGEGNRKNMG